LISFSIFYSQGKRAIFKNDENGGTPMSSIVDFAVPIIMKGELMKILDQRFEKPEMNETEAVELVAYTAVHCVHLEVKDRPTISDIVANLERAFTLCDVPFKFTFREPFVAILW
jgi:hypothetical protein